MNHCVESALPAHCELSGAEDLFSIHFFSFLMNFCDSTFFGSSEISYFTGLPLPRPPTPSHILCPQTHTHDQLLLFSSDVHPPPSPSSIATEVEFGSVSIDAVSNASLNKDEVRYPTTSKQKHADERFCPQSTSDSTVLRTPTCRLSSMAPGGAVAGRQQLTHRGMSSSEEGAAGEPVSASSAHCHHQLWVQQQR